MGNEVCEGKIIAIEKKSTLDKRLTSRKIVLFGNTVKVGNSVRTFCPVQDAKFKKINIIRKYYYNNYF